MSECVCVCVCVCWDKMETEHMTSCDKVHVVLVIDDDSIPNQQQHLTCGA